MADISAFQRSIFKPVGVFNVSIWQCVPASIRSYGTDSAIFHHKRHKAMYELPACAMAVEIVAVLIAAQFIYHAIKQAQ